MYNAQSTVYNQRKVRRGKLIVPGAGAKFLMRTCLDASTSLFFVTTPNYENENETLRDGTSDGSIELASDELSWLASSILR